MAEKQKPPIPGTLSKPTQRAAGKNNSLAPKYSLPLPLRTFPLPTFYPSNPLSLVHLAVAWIGQVLYPPPAEPSVVHHGVWSTETRSVHITDPKSMVDLWCQGFFGKGSLSRSEPSWLNREKSKKGLLGDTIEQRTTKRREERANTKWERGRTELEAIEQKKREEKEAAERRAKCTNGKKVDAPINAKLLTTPPPSEAHQDAPNGTPVPPAFRAPVGPLELLALPNSEADLLERLSSEKQRQATASDAPPAATQSNGNALNGYSIHSHFLAPVGPLELLALPNSEADLLERLSLERRREKTAPKTLLRASVQRDDPRPQESEGTVPTTPPYDSASALQDMIINGIGNHANGSSTKSNGGVSESSPEIPPIKRQKSVRFSPHVEATTFQHSDPPSPNHSMAMAVSKRPLNGHSVNGKAVPSHPPSETAEVGTGSNSNSPAEPRGPAADATAADDSGQNAVSSKTDEEIPNKEHLQLSEEEAFFLSYGLGALSVTDPETQRPMTTQQLFTRFRQFSYFPPRAAEALSPDDPFLVQYAVYHHFRSLGWVPRHGIKFGVDWLLYGKGPALDHAEFGIMVMPSYTDPGWKKGGHHGRQALRKSWHWLHSVNRVLSTVFKSLVLVYVDIPPPPAEAAGDDISQLLGQFRIREVMVRRWSANRNRD